MDQRIGLYGGSFDPPHHGHLIIARSVAEALRLDRVVFLPSARPPHKDGGTLADPNARAAMVKLCIEEEPTFELSDFDLARAGPSYTIDTIQHFRKRYGDGVELYWIIGGDSLGELTTWHRVSEIVDACHVVTARRRSSKDIDWEKLSGSLNGSQVSRLRDAVLETPIIDISATDIRRRVSKGLSIRFLLPDPVRTYIEEHKLYGSR